MPPKRPATSADLNDFIAPDNDGSGGGGDDTAAPAAKKRKSDTGKRGKDITTAKKIKAKRDGRGKGSVKAKGHSGEIGGGGKRDGKGEEFWEISGKRRVAISEYSGKTMVNVREYYEKDGESLPGKKGISLTLEQFNAVIELLPHIETVLVGKGEKVSRPDYTEQREPVGQEGGEGEQEEEEEEADEGKKKKNFEETSEEEE